MPLDIRTELAGAKTDLDRNRGWIGYFLFRAVRGLARGLLWLRDRWQRLRGTSRG